MGLPDRLRDWFPAQTTPAAPAPPSSAGLVNMDRQTYLNQLNNTAGLAASTSDETALAKSQYEDYKRRYQPIEDLLMSSYNNPAMMETRLSDTRNYINQGYNTAAGTQQRTLSRYQVGMAPEQQAQQQRSRQLAQTAAVTDGVNESRRAMAQRDEELLAGGLTANRGMVVGS